MRRTDAVELPAGCGGQAGASARDIVRGLRFGAGGVLRRRGQRAGDRWWHIRSWATGRWPVSACRRVFPAREMREAVKLAESAGVPYRLVDTEEHLDPMYAANPVNRCYFCKAELHDRLARIAAEEGWAVVVDGNNASDLGDFRPGAGAAKERGVHSPLQDADITKAEVRQIAQALGIAGVGQAGDGVSVVACAARNADHAGIAAPDRGGRGCAGGAGLSPVSRATSRRDRAAWSCRWRTLSGRCAERAAIVAACRRPVTNS